MQHILICPFGWLGKNIMLGLDGGMARRGKKARQKLGDLEEEEEGIERSGS